MSLFFSILLKIIPLYLIIVAGYLAARFYQVKKESVANLAIYIVAPSVVFIGTLKAGLAFNLLILPILSFIICVIFAIIYFYLGKLLWRDNTNSLLSFSCATGNTGYFGIPICIAIFGNQALPVVVMFALGLILFENSVGYYLFARSKHSVKESFKMLLKLPSLYAFLFGLIFNISQISTPEPLYQTLDMLKGAYAPLGMMIIGLGLSEAKKHHIDSLFMSIAFFQKFVVYLLVILAVIKIDQKWFGLFTPLIKGVLIIESVVPLPANSVAFATRFQAHPEKASIAVMISNFVALIVIPLVVAFFINSNVP